MKEENKERERDGKMKDSRGGSGETGRGRRREKSVAGKRGRKKKENDVRKESRSSERLSHK